MTMPALRAAPRVFTIPSTVSFVDALAGSLLRREAGDPLALGRYRILLPNRRSLRLLREAFLRASEGRPLLLPRMSAIGDVDEEELLLFGAPEDVLDLPPAISGQRRVFLLAQLVRRLSDRAGSPHSPAAALRLARELARLIDEVHTARVSFDRLADLAPDALAAHWRMTLDFLRIVTESWPGILAAEGALDPADRRNRLLEALARRWRETPPADPVIAAGSTGSVPATAELLGVVARLPQGAVILPGFDRDIDDESWRALDPAHPQFMMRQLLENIGVARHEVAPWPLPPSWQALSERRAPRARLFAEALRPAATIESWSRLRFDAGSALAGVRRIDARSLPEEAGAIALLLREALETPGRTAALVTPDRTLARLVQSELGRWGIAIDDSAGTPAAASPTGSFLRLLVRTVAEGFAPVGLMALMKHPLAAAGRPTGAPGRLARRLDRFGGRDGYALRGPAPAPGSQAVVRALEKAGVPKAWLRELENFLALLSPLETALREREKMPLETLLARHLDTAEALAATADDAGGERLWHGEAGEALALHLADAMAEAADFGPVETAAYPALFDALLEPLVVRPRYGRHPRLAILGTLEARLFHADLMVLGGLNEGTWPPAPAHDPWMSRAMRAAFGLPPTARRSGQAAHDFLAAAGAPEVVITRSGKRDGTPTVPSRWLSRLDALTGRAIPRAEDVLRIHRRIDRPDRVEPLPPPRPTPPVEARPKALSVTQVETWIRDPYAIYARHILGLVPLDPLEDDPGALRRGTVLHDALDRFLRERPPHEDREAAHARLLACGRAAFGALLERPAVRAFWWPRFEAIAEAFLDLEAAREAEYETLATEVRGKLTLGTPVPFTLTAKADRIDRRHGDGALEIIDYKTGAPPTKKRIEAGFAPQLPLEGWMAEAGAFTGIPAGDVGTLVFWHLKGTRVPIEIRMVKEVEKQIAAAREGLMRLVACFAREDTPYLSNPRPREAGWGDYDHLARVEEWTRLPRLPEESGS